MTDYVDYPVTGILRVKKGAPVKVLSDAITLLDNDHHEFRDMVAVGLDGFSLKFNERRRTLTVRQDAPAPKPAASTIDAAFAEMGGSGEFTLDDGPSAEDKFKAVCQERGYDAEMSKRIRAIIAQHGSSDAVKDRLNTLLKARKAKTMRVSDWAIAQELTAK